MEQILYAVRLMDGRWVRGPQHRLHIVESNLGPGLSICTNKKSAQNKADSYNNWLMSWAPLGDPNDFKNKAIVVQIKMIWEN